MFIERDILKKIVAHLDKDEITVITGPRQVGKTTC
jgi:predicted AAA+ superfamily ATPase